MEYDQHRDSSYGSGAEKELGVANRGKMRRWDMFMRVAAVVLSLAAAVVLGLDKQTTTVALKLVPTLPAVNVPVTAKWHNLSANVYFVVANSIACAYGGISLILKLASGRSRKKKLISTIIVVFDLTMVVLLFSSIGAAGAVGLIGLEGNSHLQWNKVCYVFRKFCRQGAAALAFSGAASFAFFLLVILNHHMKT